MSELRGSNGVYLTQGLFVEFGHEDAPYTLKSRDVSKNERLYRSVHKIYMESVDEYDAAMKIVGSIRHWNKLCALKWFMEGAEVFSWDGLAQLREEMAMRDRSRAKEQLQQAAAEGNATAMRLLFDSSVPAAKKSSGRPQKNQPQEEGDSVILELFKKTQVAT